MGVSNRRPLTADIDEGNGPMLQTHPLRRRRWYLGALILLFGVLLVGAGCSSDSDTGDDTGANNTESEVTEAPAADIGGEDSSATTDSDSASDDADSDATFGVVRRADLILDGTDFEWDFEVELESGEVVDATLAPSAEADLTEQEDPSTGGIVLADLIGTRVELEMDGDDWVIVAFDAN